MSTPAPELSEVALSNRVFVRNLAYATTNEALQAHMSKAGKVQHAEVLIKRNGRSVGCGLVDYENDAAAKNAVETLHGTELDGRTLQVREDRGVRIKERAPRNADASTSSSAAAASSQPPVVPSPNRIFIGNLAFATTSEDLTAFLSNSPGLVSAEVVLGFSKRSRGYGVAEFDTPEHAVQAISKFNDNELAGRTLIVREDRAAPTEKTLRTATGNRGRRSGQPRRPRGNGSGEGSTSAAPVDGDAPAAVDGEKPKRRRNRRKGPRPAGAAGVEGEASAPAPAAAAAPAAGVEGSKPPKRRNRSRGKKNAEGGAIVDVDASSSSATPGQ